MPRFSPKQVGQRIRLIRGKKTQTAFARLMGVYKQNYISRYEHGRVPSPRLLIKLADYGRVTLDWLLAGKGTAAHLNGKSPGRSGNNRRKKR